MNQSFLNPFATPSIPESVHQVIAPNTESACLCARFNPRGIYAGHYIATARADCGVAIYDLETKGLIRFLEGHTRPVTCLSWSDSGRYLATAGLDWNVVVWDLKANPAARVRTIRFDAPVSQVQFGPSTSKVLLVTLESQQALIVDLRRQRRRKLSPRLNGSHTDAMEVDDTVELSKAGDSSRGKPSPRVWQTFETRLDLAAIHARRIASDPEQHGHLVDTIPPITTAQFHPSGSHVIAGTSRGDLLAFSFRRGGQLIAQVSTSGSSAIREISFDRSGRNLVVNSNDRSIRVVAIDVTSHSTQSDEGIQMQVLHRFQDLVNRTPWNGIGFSGDGEYVYAGAAHQAAHNIYVWDKGAGALDKILEGPREPLVDADWHPTRPLLLSVSVSGSINIWFTPNAENWSAYAPGFEELEENIEYQEGEDEFDLEDEDELSRRKMDEEEADVNVLTLGPLPGGSGPKVIPELLDPEKCSLSPRPLQNQEEGDLGWEYQWVDDPERQTQDFALWVNLEERDLDDFA